MPDHIVVSLSGELAPSQVNALCERVRGLLEASGRKVVVCDVHGIHADAVALDALARLQLTAQQVGCRMQLRHVCEELLDLIALVGLKDVLVLVDAAGGGRWQREEGRRQMAAKVVHFEVITNQNADELQKFYSEVFGWSVQNPPALPEGIPPYGLVSADDAGIGGGIGATGDSNAPGHVTFYIGVPDPEATMQQIESKGGTRLMGPSEVVPGTVIALFKDPDGNMVGLSKVE